MKLSPKVRREVQERSGGLCEIGIKGICRGRATDYCHVKSRARGGGNGAENLKHGCRPCHDHIDSNKPGWEKHRAHGWQQDGEVAADA
jgi:hypothetical protein